MANAFAHWATPPPLSLINETKMFDGQHWIDDSIVKSPVCYTRARRFNSLITIYNASSRGSDALFLTFVWAPGIHVVHIHTYRQNKYTHKNQLCIWAQGEGATTNGTHRLLLVLGGNLLLNHAPHWLSMSHILYWMMVPTHSYFLLYFVSVLRQGCTI